MAMSPAQQRQKEAAQQEAERHHKYANAQGMSSREVFSDASGKPSAMETEVKGGGGYMRKELK